MSTEQAQAVPEAKQTLRNRAPELHTLVEIDEPFCVWDAMDEEMDRDEYNRVMSTLISLGVIRRVGERTRNYTYEVPDGDRLVDSYERVYEYEWKEQYRQYVQRVQEETNTLPCGHRAHVLNKGDEEYGCQYCDAERSYSRETVMRCLE